MDDVPLTFFLNSFTINLLQGDRTVHIPRNRRLDLLLVESLLSFLFQTHPLLGLQLGHELVDDPFGHCWTMPYLMGIDIGLQILRRDGMGARKGSVREDVLQRFVHSDLGRL